MATRSKKFAPVPPIVWEDIQARCARMNVRPSFSTESGIVLRIGDRVFTSLSVLEVANMLLTLEAAYAAIGYECYACMSITFNDKSTTVSDGEGTVEEYRLCTVCATDWLY